ncbi:MAG: tripartite tricarboxylate transporter permease [Candidatus Aenigmarchaeota archaeon]|nr:tripartite tricarboxylate transporter permease [Candidatus Aenigmarchaeota archaeon]
MIDLLLALALGIGFGIVAGLLPGLHPNNTIPIILGLSFILGPLPTAIILVTSGVSNSFINFIPSILLGAPEDSTALGVLPGHRLLMKGRGYEAIKLCVIGCLGGVAFSVLTLPIFIFVIPKLYEAIRQHVHWLLIAVIGYMLLSEKGKNKLICLGIFLMSGFLGLIVLNNYADSALFPLLTGIFGMPMLLLSIFEKTKLPASFSFEEEKIERKTLLSCIGVGSIGGIIAGLLPGLGATQSTMLTQNVLGRQDESGRNFLISIGAITTCDIVYSILSLWLIGNPRSGIAVGVSQLMEVGMKETMMFIAMIVITAGISTILTLKMTRISLRFLGKIDYQKLCLYTTIFLFILTFIFSGMVGMLIFAVSIAVGMIPNLLNVRRTYGMGCLILPCMLFFMGISLL